MVGASASPWQDFIATTLLAGRCGQRYCRESQNPATTGLCEDTMRLCLTLLVIMLTLPGLSTADDMSIHVLERPDAPALVPVIEPLLPAGGSVRAYRGKLIVRTTEASMQELQSVLGGLEATPSTLIVHLRRQQGSSSQQGGIDTQVRGRIESGQAPVIQGEVRIGQQSRQQQRQDHYQIRTLSGYPANVSQGTLVALSGGYYGTTFAQLDQGIQVTPQLAADGSVVLQISQRFDQPASHNTARTQHSATTLRVTPGRWQPMGSITVTQSGSRQSIGGYQSGQQSMTLPLEVMVEQE